MKDEVDNITKLTFKQSAKQSTAAPASKGEVPIIIDVNAATPEILVTSERNERLGQDDDDRFEISFCSDKLILPFGWHSLLLSVSDWAANVTVVVTIDDCSGADGILVKASHKGRFDWDVSRRDRTDEVGKKFTILLVKSNVELNSGSDFVIILYYFVLHHVNDLKRRHIT